MQFADFTEMVAVNGESDGQREQLGAAEKRPKHEVPIMDALFADDAQVVDRTEERQNVLKLQRRLDLGWLVLS